MNDSKKYEYKVRGAFYFLIVAIFTSIVGSTLFFALLEQDASKPPGKMIVSLFTLVFFSFVIFIFLYNWRALRIGVDSNGLYVPPHGFVPWDAIESFKISRTRYTARGATDWWTYTWVIINLKEGKGENLTLAEPGGALLVGPDFYLSKKASRIKDALKKYHKKYS